MFGDSLPIGPEAVDNIRLSTHLSAAYNHQNHLVMSAEGYDVDRSNRLSFDEFLQMFLEVTAFGRVCVCCLCQHWGQMCEPCFGMKVQLYDQCRAPKQCAELRHTSPCQSMSASGFSSRERNPAILTPPASSRHEGFPQWCRCLQRWPQVEPSQPYPGPVPKMLTAMMSQIDTMLLLLVRSDICNWCGLWAGDWLSNVTAEVGLLFTWLASPR